MSALELVRNRDPKQPDPDLTASNAIIDEAIDRLEGVIRRLTGT